MSKQRITAFKGHIHLLARRAFVSKSFLVARNADGLVIVWDVVLSSERLIALPTAEMLQVPVAIFRLRVLRSEYELLKKIRYRVKVYHAMHDGSCITTARANVLKVVSVLLLK